MVNGLSTKVHSNIESERGEVGYDFGQYYRYVNAADTLDKYFTLEEIFVVTTLHINQITKNVHSLTLYIPAHLQNGGRSFRVSINDLEKHFVFVDPDTAIQERKKLIAQFEEQATAIQDELKIAFTSPNEIMNKIMTDKNENVQREVAKLDTNVPLLPPAKTLASSNVISSVGGQKVDVLRRQLQNQQVLGGVLTEYAKAKNAEMSVVLSHAADIQMESAKVAKGRANSMIATVGDVESKIEQISLYLGENVDVVNVIDGDVSTSLEKFCFFSHKLYIDDEMLTHKIFEQGDFDQYELEHFFDLLRDNAAFLSRILPTERCVVVLQPRRTPRKYSDCPFSNYALNQGNFDSFLLVRDGDRVSAVHSNITYQKRLFPTQLELDKHFNDINDADDTTLTDAQRKLNQLASMYMKVASILQGIADRQDAGGVLVFGEFCQQRFAGSLFDPDCVERNVTFVNDEDYLIGSKPWLTQPRKWLLSHYSDEHRINDLLLIDSSIIDEDTAPQAYDTTNGSGEYAVTIWDYDETDANELKQVKLRKTGNHCIQVNMTNRQYNRKNYGTKRTMSVNVDYANAFLNLRYIKLSELNDIIASRVARPDIANLYLMKSLRQAREIITEIMPRYELYIELMQRQQPDLDREDCYLAALNVVLSKGGDFKQPPAPKRGWIEMMINYLNEKNSISDTSFELAEQFVKAKDTLAVGIAELEQKVVLITGSLFQTRSLSVETATFFKRGYNILVDLQLHQMLPNGDIHYVSELDDATRKQLKNMRFMPLTQNEKPKTARDREKMREDMRNAYHTGITFNTPIDTITALVASNQHDHEVVKQANRDYELMQHGNDLVKQGMIEKYLAVISDDKLLEKINVEEREYIATPRQQAIVGFSIQYAEVGFSKVYKVHVSSLFVDYYALIARMIDNLKDNDARLKMMQQFKHIATDLYCMQDDFFSEFYANFLIRKPFSGWNVLFPCDDDIYKWDLYLTKAHNMHEDDFKRYLS
ncbi:hypothetical protein [Photobacterium leiognathi]|uniref:hypothetical protein n=1 Tax=Photobacterium leiognathi TaxID=553611 RepID=UPI0029823B14|nr:hypothetical protein [Photobacterium leiognathi]